MIKRDDWQAFYRQQVKTYGDLIRLPEVLPPRCRSSTQEGEQQKDQGGRSGADNPLNQPAKQRLDKIRTRTSSLVKED